MEPQVQYVQAKDGTSIAYAVYGGGPGIPLVKLPTAMGSHLEHNLKMIWEVYGREIESWSATRTVVHFDPRGSGLSDRNISDFSLDAMVSDLEAVVDRLGFERFGMRPQGSSTMHALAYAAKHPERVAYIAAFGGTPAGRLQWGSPRLQAALAIAWLDWESFFQAYPRLNIWGWDDRRASPTERGGRTIGDDITEYSEYMQASLSQEDFLRRVEAELEYDVTALLPSVLAPVVVVAGDRLAISRDTRESSRVLVTRLPNARLQRMPAFLEEGVGNTWVTLFDEFDRRAAEGATPPPAAVPLLEAPPGIRSILFTDLEAHTSMMSRLGDAAGRDVLREHERLTREALRAHGGTEVKAMGDGFMAWFPSVTGALDCASALQRAFEERSTTGAEPLSVRIGINAGEPVAEDNDLFGAAVIQAARVAGEAQGGQVVVTDVVRQLVTGKQFVFADRGVTEIRGFTVPVRTWELIW